MYYYYYEGTYNGITYKRLLRIMNSILFYKYFMNLSAAVVAAVVIIFINIVIVITRG